MLRFIKNVLCFFFVVVLSSITEPILGQEYLFDVQKINVKDGLPHRRVFDIVEDKDGFIWISTIGSINKYDGYQIRVYNEGDQANRTSERHINKLQVDQFGQLILQ